MFQNRLSVDNNKNNMQRLIKELNMHTLTIHSIKLKNKARILATKRKFIRFRWFGRCLPPLNVILSFTNSEEKYQPHWNISCRIFIWGYSKPYDLEIINLEMTHSHSPCSRFKREFRSFLKGYEEKLLCWL